MDAELIHGDKTYRVVLEKSEGNVTGRVDDRPIEADVVRTGPNGLSVTIGGTRRRAWAARADGKVFVHVGGRAYVFEEAGGDDQAARGAGGGPGGDSVISSMPGKVVKILVAVGDAVTEGQPLVIVEAMKMETPLPSPAAGTVKKVNFGEGDLVDAGKPIVELDVKEE